MSWMALLLVLVILVAAISMLVAWAWPRDKDGQLMDPEEVEKMLDNFSLRRADMAPSDRGKLMVLGFLMLLAMTGIALTRRD